MLSASFLRFKRDVNDMGFQLRKLFDKNDLIEMTLKTRHVSGFNIWSAVSYKHFQLSVKVLNIVLTGNRKSLLSNRSWAVFSSLITMLLYT